jgi:hypothetical protein
MLTVDQIKERLQDANLQRVAAGAGLHPHTLYRLMAGKMPLYATVVTISNYLTKHDFKK